MATESYVELSCPACGNDWEDRPRELPPTDENWTCPQCNERRPLAEFMDSQTDLEAVEQFHREST